ARFGVLLLELRVPLCVGLLPLARPPERLALALEVGGERRDAPLRVLPRRFELALRRLRRGGRAPGFRQRALGVGQAGGLQAVLFFEAREFFVTALDPLARRGERLARFSELLREVREGRFACSDLGLEAAKARAQLLELVLQPADRGVALLELRRERGEGFGLAPPIQVFERVRGGIGFGLVVLFRTAHQGVTENLELGGVLVALGG